MSCTSQDRLSVPERNRRAASDDLIHSRVVSWASAPPHNLYGLPCNSAIQTFAKKRGVVAPLTLREKRGSSGGQLIAEQLAGTHLDEAITIAGRRLEANAIDDANLSAPVRDQSRLLQDADRDSDRRPSHAQHL